MTEVRIVDLLPEVGAGIEVYSKWGDLASTVRITFDRLYAPGALAPGHGKNFVLYTNETRDGGALLVGVLGRRPSGSNGEIQAVEIPGGRAITATHWGDYTSMRQTYDVLHAEVRARALRRIWTSLEIYGDWDEDLSKVRTDLYLYLGVAM